MAARRPRRAARASAKVSMAAAAGGVKSPGREISCGRRPDLDAELLHPIPEAALRDAEDLGGARLDAARLAERVEDHAALPVFERLVEGPGERRVDGGIGGGRGGPLGGRRGGGRRGGGGGGDHRRPPP